MSVTVKPWIDRRCQTSINMDNTLTNIHQYINTCTWSWKQNFCKIFVRIGTEVSRENLILLSVLGGKRARQAAARGIEATACRRWPSTCRQKHSTCRKKAIHVAFYTYPLYMLTVWTRFELIEWEVCSHTARSPQPTVVVDIVNFWAY